LGVPDCYTAPYALAKRPVHGAAWAWTRGPYPSKLAVGRSHLRTSRTSVILEASLRRGRLDGSTGPPRRTTSPPGVVDREADGPATGRSGSTRFPLDRAPAGSGWRSPAHRWEVLRDFCDALLAPLQCNDRSSTLRVCLSLHTDTRGFRTS